MIPFLTRKRRLRRPKIPHSQIGLSCSITLSLLMTLVVFGLVLGYIYLSKDLPSLDQLAIELDPQQGRIYQPTRLYDRSGQHEILTLENPAAAGWKVLSLDPSQPDHLPSTLIKATLAAQDPTFWQNPGFSLSALTQQAHPTIAQRLVYELLLSQEPAGLRRNLRERLLAAQLIQKFGHMQVLEWYLNTLQYGPYIYGADAAGRAFFGKPASQLTLAEAAFLTALAENPQANAWNAPQEIQARQKEIIALMLGQGWITAAEADQASKADLVLRPPEPLKDLAPSFSQLVLAQLARQFPGEDLSRGGWKVITTLDLTLQQQAECTVAVQLARIQRQAPLPTCPAARLLPTLASDLAGERDDLSAAVVILDPKQGQVLAMVGDSSTPRPAGTILTPMIYLSAFARGLGPASLVWDIPDPTQTSAAPAGQDPSQTFRGPMRLRTALVNDYLQPAVTISRQLGWEVIRLAAVQLGISSVQSLPADDPNALITKGETSLLEITRAFSIFANQGVLMGQINLNDSDAQAPNQLISPVSVLRLSGGNDEIWLDWSQPVGQSVISAQLAYLMNHILSDEPARWLSLGHPNPLEVGRPAGAKIGFTADHQDGWTIGYTPRIVIGVWVGKSRLTPGSISTEIPAGIWHALIQYASQSQPLESWEVPPGIQFIDVCDPSGLLPTEDCPTVVNEVFLPGNEPTQYDYLYRSFQINRQTNRLATVFTPPELIEEKVYLVPPPEAQAWAQAAGLPNPPSMYDVIQSAPANEQTHITSPAMFAHVRGVVEFRGAASGPDFAFYRLQIGQGLNPETWIQLGEDGLEPVEEGVLGVWDTRQSSGLYAVQLLVVRKDQRVERFVTQVTVDNQPPEVEILTPKSNQEVVVTSSAALALQASLQDNLEIERGEFWVDKRLIATLYEPPYLVAWQATPGDHTFLVRAFDLAGNIAETAVIFHVK